jgi:NADPH:quinone reductase-like Zn-dependent oxidoreductase
VAARAVGVNPIDWKLRSGAMARFMPGEFPSVPGEEVAGVVDEVAAAARRPCGRSTFCGTAEHKFRLL